MGKYYNIFDLAIARNMNIEGTFELARDNNIAISDVLTGELENEMQNTDRVCSTGYKSILKPHILIDIPFVTTYQQQLISTQGIAITSILT